MDNHNKQQRSYNMSRIRSKDTKPEELVRKYLFKNGFRYKKNDVCLPGKPDISLPKYRIVIFVNGCFWHKHDCPRFQWPQSNTEYWMKKITGNIANDKRNYTLLQEQGWKVIVIWECELNKGVREARLQELQEKLFERRDEMSKTSGLKPGQPAPKSGQYGVVGPKGGNTGKEITSTKGNILPPTGKPGSTYNLVDPTKNKSGK